MFGNHERWTATALAGGLVALVALAGCGKDPSVASRSAAAFHEAQKKGQTFEGAAGSHGHGALTPRGGQDQSGTDGMKMGGKGLSGMGEMKMDGKGQSGMSGMDMSGKGQSGMAMGGKDHSGIAIGGMSHSGMAMGGKNPSAGPPAVARPVSALPGQPAKTLSADPLDSPAATSVLDARRSAEMAAEMSGGMDGMSGMGGTYRQVDAGRGPGAYEGSEKQTPGGGPHQHGQAPQPPPAQEPEHSLPPAAGAAHEEAAVYTCSMHREVTSTAPGERPTCGMTLVARRQG